MFDLTYDPKEFEKRAELAEKPLPEGERLFFVNNAWISNWNNSPKGKQYPTDFTARLFIQFKDAETGKLIMRLDNGQEGYFRTNIFLYRVGALTNLDLYNEMMEKINQKKKKLYHAIINGEPQFLGYEDDGILGMPVKLMLVHKVEPVLTVREGAEKNQWGRYDEADLIQKLDENGKPMVKTVEYIACSQPDGEGWEARIRSGFPIILPLTDEEKDLRSEHAKSKSSDDLAAEELPTDVDF